MNEQYPTAEFLVICRGEWDSTLLQKEKQNVIDQFYAWFDELVDLGKIKRAESRKAAKIPSLCEPDSRYWRVLN
jgi:hypothetical protein